MQVTFRDVSHSPALETLIDKKLQELEHHYDRITSCHVLIGTPHRHKRTSESQYQVTLELRVPGAELVVTRPTRTRSNDDVQVAVRSAFRAAKRQLHDYVSRLRRQVKTLVTPPHARVVRLFSFEGYGFLEKADGEEVYFERNAVLNGAFDRLQEGDEVRFAAERGEQGLRATTVATTSRHLLTRDVEIVS